MLFIYNHVPAVLKILLWYYLMAANCPQWCTECTLFTLITDLLSHLSMNSAWTNSTNYTFGEEQLNVKKQEGSRLCFGLRAVQLWHSDKPGTVDTPYAACGSHGCEAGTDNPPQTPLVPNSTHLSTEIRINTQIHSGLHLWRPDLYCWQSCSRFKKISLK